MAIAKPTDRVDTHRSQKELIRLTRYDSPAGEMLIGTLGDKLCLCDWGASRRRDTIDRRVCRDLRAAYGQGVSETAAETMRQLDEYFAGTRRGFTIPVLYSGTPFQCRVWDELTRIPYGTTVSYAEIARRVGNPRGVRAVAAAIATNPISIIVPCHRVIGSDNRLTGYGGGLDAKRVLLHTEGLTLMP